MCDMYNISEKKYSEIIEKKRNMEYFMEYKDIFIVLYEDPEGAKRPRFRIVNRKNYMYEAILNPQFVHVYSPNASDDSKYMRRVLDQNELLDLHKFIQTQCIVNYSAFFKVPSNYNITDTFISEIGLHRNTVKPDWDNIGKKYSDMSNENIWLDDSLVVKGTSQKFYSILPRIEIKIRYLNYATNKQQYMNIVNRKEYNTDYPISYLDHMGRPIINELY